MSDRTRQDATPLDRNPMRPPERPYPVWAWFAFVVPFWALTGWAFAYEAWRP